MQMKHYLAKLYYEKIMQSIRVAPLPRYQITFPLIRAFLLHRILRRTKHFQRRAATTKEEFEML